MFEIHSIRKLHGESYINTTNINSILQFLSENFFTRHEEDLNINKQPRIVLSNQDAV